MIRIPAGLHGAHHRADLEAHLGRGQLRTAVAEGRLVRWSRFVLVERHHLLNPLTRAAATLLTAGDEAVLSGHTAAHLHGCTAADTTTVHVTLPHRQRLRMPSGVTVRHVHLDEADVVHRQGLRCLALDTTIAELLCLADRRTALACADQALALHAPGERAAFKADVEVQVRERLDPRGRRRGLFLLDVTTGLPESPPESWLLLLLVDEGLPVPEPQYPVRDITGREIYRLDFAWPELRVALEYDGYAAHAERGTADAARDVDLARRGWTVIRADVSDLRNPQRLLARLKKELGVSERSTHHA
ncbi:DUF559 domain-containing protein [Umezawaea beigongshangensis]|uniref:DUF559 domain-containing protein n=1 Tax=Umezawaea beigongshangensis TaxID=2780383 RepID=UPI0018F1DC41|nr:DUF559 domain-containing protein [Umezawaea beigongshangensis]